MSALVRDSAGNHESDFGELYLFIIANRDGTMHHSSAQIDRIEIDESLIILLNGSVF